MKLRKHLISLIFVIISLFSFVTGSFANQSTAISISPSMGTEVGCRQTLQAPIHIEPSGIPTTGKVDLAILLDGSGSISSSSFAKMKEQYLTLFNKLDIGPTQANVMIVQFGGTGSTKTRLEQVMTADKQTITTRLSNIPQMTGTSYYLDGLKRVKGEFDARGRADSEKIIVSITDGPTYIPEDPQNNNLMPVIEYADQLRTEGIRFFNINITNTQNSALTAAMKTISTNPGHHFDIASTASVDLPGYIQKIADNIKNSSTFEMTVDPAFSVTGVSASSGRASYLGSLVSYNSTGVADDLIVTLQHKGSANETVKAFSEAVLRYKDSEGISQTQTLSPVFVNVSGCITLPAATLPAATAGATYSATVSPAGGKGPFQWAVVGGALPSGLSLNTASGVISGTPSQSGAASFRLEVTDSYSLKASQNFSLNVYSPVAVGNQALSPATVGQPYSQTLTATGGNGAYTWSLGGGSLPAGLTLDASGVVSGTPTQAVSNATFVARATDGNGAFATKSFAINVNPALQITKSGTLSTGTVGRAFAENLTATGGSGSYSWDLVSGELPPSVGLNVQGTLIGTPSQAGDFSFTLRVRDTLNISATQLFQLRIHPQLIVATSAPAVATVGQAYSQQLAATGGDGSYTWSVVSGTLPAGLSLGSDGLVSGVAAQEASEVSVTVRVTDSNGAVTTKQFTWQVNPALVITNGGTLPTGTVGQSYTQQLSASGGSGTYSWSVVSGSLPDGLTLNASGVVSGTPEEAAASAAFTVQVADGNGVKVTKALTLTVNEAVVVTTGGTLPTGTVGQSYTQQLSASGGSGTYSWSVVSGELPEGLTLNASGVLSGTPEEAAASAAFTVQVADGNGVKVTKALTLTVNEAVVVTTGSTLPTGTVGQSYTQQLSASGGNGTYSWSVVSGSLPEGLTLNASGVVSGTPEEAAASAAFTVQVADGNGVNVTKALTMSVNEAVVVTTGGTLPTATAGQSYTQQLSASGGSGTYSWSVVSGELPDGLTLNASGVLSGTPEEAAANVAFTVQATDGNGVPATKALTLSVNETLVVTTGGTLPTATVGQSYTQQLSASGGSGTYSWSVVSGELPDGLTLNASGVVSGTPEEAAANATFTVQVADGNGVPATKALTLTVNEAVVVTTGSTLPTATAGQSYTQQLTATGGSGTYSWSVVSGELPEGLALNASGVLSGTPEEAAANAMFTVQATDGNGVQVTKALTLSVNPELVLDENALPAAVVGQPYAKQLSAAGGNSVYTWSVVAGELPPGLALNASGTLSGVPGEATPSVTFTVQAVDGNGVALTQQLSLRVNPQLLIVTGSLPNGMVSQPYAQSLAASGGDGVYAWSITNGTLPAGLALSDGLYGAPAIEGESAFTVRVTDGQGYWSEQMFAITVGPYVAPTMITHIQLDEVQYEVTIGDSRSTVTTAVYDTGAHADITQLASYSIADSSIAAVGDDGQIIGLAPGQTTLRVSYENYFIEASVTVSVVQPELSHNAELAALQVSEGALNPAFQPSHAQYTLTVAPSSARISITAFTSDASASLKWNGRAYASGEIASLPLLVGGNRLELVITAQDGLTSKTYTIYVTRPAEGRLPVPAVPLLGTATTIKPDEQSGVDIVYDTDKKSARIRINEERIQAMLDQKEAIKSVTIDASGIDAEQIQAVLSDNSLARVVVENPDALLELRGPEAAYLVPVKQLIAATPNLASSSAEQDIRWMLQIKKLNQPLAGSLNGQIAPIVDFTVWMERDGAAPVEMRSFSAPVTRKISISKLFDPRQAIAVRIEQDGSMTPMPTWFEKGEAVVMSYTNSAYTVVAQLVEFQDVPSAHWAHAAIAKMANKRLVDGYGDQTFRPGQQVTRAESAVLLARSLGMAGSMKPKSASFADVEASDWFAPLVGIAFDYGIVQGTSPQLFQPGAVVTREQMAVMLSRILPLSGRESSASGAAYREPMFSDEANLSAWSAAAVHRLHKLGIIQGYADGTFLPQASVTRAELAVMLERVLVVMKYMNP